MPLNCLILAFLIVASATTSPPDPDTLVVCPSEFRPALADWERFRVGQGHRLMVVDSQPSAAQLKDSIRRAGRTTNLKYVVIVGDEPSVKDSREVAHRLRVATNYVPAKVNSRWGPEKEIATDTPYGDLDSDGTPDLAVGRIPVHSADELAGVVRKIIQYESQTDHGPWEKHLSIVSGTGGFGAIADAMIEAAGKQVIQQTVPPNYTVQHIFNSTAIGDTSGKDDFVGHARQQMNVGGLAWIYVGHGMPTDLLYAPGTGGMKSVLSMRDVARVRCGVHKPLVVLVACYAGAMDASQGCLGEQLLLAEAGPIAVIAATRVTMPYGNTVTGYELLKACFTDRPETLGDVFLLAQQRILSDTSKEQGNQGQLRATLEGVAAMLSPPPVDLEGERREHAMMYQLIGDPLVRLHRSAEEVAQTPATTKSVK